jgi:hypothetical protein
MNEISSGAAGALLSDTPTGSFFGAFSTTIPLPVRRRGPECERR